MPRMLLLLISLLSGLGIMGAGESVAKSNEIDVSLEIVDEQGRGVPYATIWSYLLPRENPLAINAADLVRVTTRYQSSFEFAIRADSNRPVTSLKINPMGDAFGRFQRKIDYRQEEGSEAKRPEKMSIGYAVMKRGYLPAFVDFSLTRESSVSGKVVLKSDPTLAPESQPYLVKFERLRYELSDQRLNVEISEKNHQRMERLRMELEETARQALEVGDKRAAARIYARMEYLPSIRFIGGKPAGFSQADATSEQSIAYFEKAYSLDPTLPYIAANYLFRQGAVQFGGSKYNPKTADQEQKRRFQAYLSTLHALMRAHSVEIWPTHHQLYALWLLKSSDPEDRERVRPLLEELFRVEPKFKTREKLLSSAL